ncbi:MAG: hypothetical protein AW07_01572 [Candidatus Accumulibacter sp. SK-11]|nr:MAG: hypothetical protein AW07_01572 [Candidatus Accumulibacter sp. SK-11]
MRPMRGRSPEAPATASLVVLTRSGFRLLPVAAAG